MRQITILSLLLLVALLPAATFSQDNATDEQWADLAMEKQTELAEDGWTLFGTSGTVEQKLVSHYAKMEKAQASEIFGYAIATDFQKIDELHRRAELDAKSRYLKERHSFIVSRIATELGLAGSGMEEVEDFYTNNRLNADGVVRNELKESYSLLRKTADGQTEILVFYIVSPQEAVNANIEAFRKAKKKTHHIQ